MNKLILTLTLIFLMGCGKDNTILQSENNTKAVNGFSITVNSLVVAENNYRASLGQQPLTQGLTCNLYTVPTTTTTITGASLTSIGSFGYYGEFNEPNKPAIDGFNILPKNIRNIYKTWFLVKCIGQLVVSDDNYHEFDLSSDDGSKLYIDGLLINNDGLHGITTKSSSKFLKHGFHSFELDYFQADGNLALILTQDGQVLDNSGFYH